MFNDKEFNYKCLPMMKKLLKIMILKIHIKVEIIRKIFFSRKSLFSLIKFYLKVIIKNQKRKIYTKFKACIT